MVGPGSSSSSSKSRASIASIRRFRYLAIASCIACVLLVSGRYSHPETFSALTSFSPSSSFSSSSSSSQQCDPYQSLGYLHVSTFDANAHRWHPFREDCHAPAYLAALVKEAWSIQEPTNSGPLTKPSAWRESDLGPDGREWQDVSWARNKTVVIVGDSVMRFNALYFCKIMGENFVEMKWDHPWSPPSPMLGKPMHGHKRDSTPLSTNSNSDSNDTTTTTIAKSSNAGNPNSHLTHYCHIPSIDLFILQIFHVGLDEDEAWIHKEGATTAYTVEDRIDKLLKVYLQKLEEQEGRSAPVLGYLQSSLWDAARWTQEDAKANAPEDLVLSDERLRWFRRRVREVILHMRRAFPSMALRWMTTHYPVNPSTGRFFDSKRPPSRLDWLSQINAASLSAFRDTDGLDPEEARLLRGVQSNNWGDLMMGQEKHLADDLHPAMFPGGYLWGDMMLWDLKQAVTQRSSLWSRG
ncbi:hypothetical protein BCR39DRAFT_525369 [Naematelia encephala]|uniref:GDSL/SGNH-like acyl-esterase family found in Pmr5 and Cas1p-domain-containing protein n=1 Tax=Naematelia encephala TaxID=71784 RepID=A0A1Y2BAB0_9TREE|nr:hypothetical protein BCR39DRAFT_525369 [Naematelia encephala]